MVLSYSYVPLFLASHEPPGLINLVLFGRHIGHCIPWFQTVTHLSFKRSHKLLELAFIDYKITILRCLAYELLNNQKVIFTWFYTKSV